MYQVKLLNNISKAGLASLGEGFAISDENPDAILVRSADMLSYDFNDNLLAIARAAVGLLAEAIETPEGHKPRQITVEGTLLEGDTLGEPAR